MKSKAAAITSETVSPDPMMVCSSTDIKLTGITWASDFGFSPDGNHGIQPLYKIDTVNTSCPFGSPVSASSLGSPFSIGPATTSYPSKKGHLFVASFKLD